MLSIVRDFVIIIRGWQNHPTIRGQTAGIIIPRLPAYKTNCPPEDQVNLGSHSFFGGPGIDSQLTVGGLLQLLDLQLCLG